MIKNLSGSIQAHKSKAKILTLMVSVMGLGGCSVMGAMQGNYSPNVPVTQSTLPSKVQPYQPIERALSCIRDSGALKGKTFIVGPFADSTGKINAVATGATGAFVPQGGSASYVTDAIAKAGGRVISTYFGSPTINAPAQYMINGIFNTLDFGTAFAADVRIAGVGPIAQVGWAQLTLSIQLDEAGTRLNRQMSMIQRPVRFSSLGAGVGAVWGTTLVTGTVVAQNQERLQFEALNGPVALGIADVLVKEFAKAQESCGAMVLELLHPVQPGDMPAPNGTPNEVITQPVEKQS